MGNSSSKALAFQGALFRLQDQVMDPFDDQFWSLLWDTPDTVAEVFNFASPTELRKIRDAQPESMIAIIEAATIMLERLASAPLPLKAPVKKAALNAVRVLTRVVPFYFESKSYGEIEADLWTLPEGSSGDEGEGGDGAGAGGEDDIEVEGEADQTDGSSKKHPLGRRLVDAVMTSMFLPYFTVSGGLSHPSVGPDSPHTHIWEAGLGTSVGQPAGTLEAPRVELVRLLLVLMSQTLYRAQDDHEGLNHFVLYATSTAVPHARALGCSMLNVIAAYDPTAFVPLGNLLSDPRADLVGLCVQLMFVFLDSRTDLAVKRKEDPKDYGAEGEGGDKDDEGQKEGEEEPAKSDADFKAGSLDDISVTMISSNVYLNLVSDIDDPDAVIRLTTGFTRLLRVPADLANNYLPNYHTRWLNYHQEVIALTWKMCEINYNFVQSLVRGPHSLSDYLVPLLVAANDAARDNVLKFSQGHAAVFLLLLLSGEREFCVSLRQPYKDGPRMGLPVFYGNHADALFLTIHHMMSVGKGAFVPLYHIMLTILVNVSPYSKSLCLTTAQKLGVMLESLANPRFLFGEENNHGMLTMLITVFNNIVQYQYEGNPHLIYALVRKQPIFERLNDLSLDDVPRRRAKRKTKTSPAYGREGVKGGEGQEAGTELEEVEAETPVAQPEGFEPTQEWFDGWYPKLREDLHVINLMLNALVPVFNGICANPVNATEEQIITWLEKNTLVGLLPVPHPIVVRRFMRNEPMARWFTNYIWGLIFMNNGDPPIWYGSGVKFFAIMDGSGKAVDPEEVRADGKQHPPEDPDMKYQETEPPKPSPYQIPIEGAGEGMSAPDFGGDGGEDDATKLEVEDAEESQPQ